MTVYIIEFKNPNRIVEFSEGLAEKFFVNEWWKITYIDLKNYYLSYEFIFSDKYQHWDKCMYKYRWHKTIIKNIW